MQALLEKFLLNVKSYGIVGGVITVVLLTFIVSFALAFVFWLCHARSLKKRYR